MAVHPGAAAVEQDRPAYAGADRAVDSPPDRWRERDEDDLGALAAHAQHPVAVLFAEVGNVSPGGFEDPQTEHGDQLRVIFPLGTLREAAVAALRRCAGGPLVARIGNVRWFRRPGEPPGSQTATIYTHAMPVGARHLHLLACLRRSPSVTQASWPD